MKRQPRILAGTAIGLLMASAPLGAYPLLKAGATEPRAQLLQSTAVPFTLAQADCLEGETAEDCATRLATPAPETQGEESGEPETTTEETVTPPAGEAETTTEETVTPPAGEAETTTEETVTPPAGEAETTTEETVTPPAGEAETTTEETVTPPAGEAETTTEETVTPPAGEAETTTEETVTPPAGEAETTTEETVTPPAGEAETTTEETVTPPAGEAETTTEETVTPPAGEAETTTEETVTPPAGEAETTTEETVTPPAGETPTTDQAGQPVEDPNAAPILDSAKEELLPVPAEGEAQTDQAVVPAPVVDPGPPPETDAAAQQDAQPVEVKAVKEEEGKRRTEAPKQEDRERRDGVEILSQIAGQIVIQIGNQIVVENDDRPRIGRGATEVYYEDLPRGKTRETVVRPNGNQIVTIRNRHGDILRRSRITPDGREYVLNYVDDQYYENIEEWRDPGLDLPPMKLNIPRNQYILEAEFAEDPDQYYEFLDQPPVERVQRLYSVDEVKRSARVRDIARRVDLDTLTFEFGSASIPEDEVGKLQNLATAMTRMLEQNPAETFLIEGHTDAVGSDVANLGLSDKRAEAVADALTDYFEIPPENLSTQGYGERYLKVKSDGPERDNRRVAVRRITALVAPIASAN